MDDPAQLVDAAQLEPGAMLPVRPVDYCHDVLALTATAIQSAEAKVAEVVARVGAAHEDQWQVYTARAAVEHAIEAHEEASMRNATAGPSFSMPAKYVQNPGGTLDIYYDADRPPWHEYDIHRQPIRQSQHIGNGSEPPWAGSPALWPAVNRREEYLLWAEQQAAANAITPPYMGSAFQAESVLP